jgi:small-conductance mechanosensitive channel/CRP-like cAMP-binding protein
VNREHPIATMTAWDRLVQLTASSPFTGTWMSLATAVGGVAAVLLARRLIPPDDRPHGGATLVLLLIGLLLGAFRLVLVALGAQDSAPGRLIGLLTTFCVALGTVNAAILFVFEVLPARSRLRLPTIMRDLIQMVALVVILFGSISHNGLATFGSLVTTSAVLTAVLALSLQSTTANLFAGIVLHMDRVLGEGDWVQLGARTGRIAQIRWRSTILLTSDGDNVIIPNTQLTTQEVYNFSRPVPRHRVWLRVSFAYRHPPNDVRQALAAATRAAPGVLAEPPPDCLPVDFSDSGVVYMVRFWIPDFARRAEIEGEVRTRIWYAARRAGLEIANPLRPPPALPAEGDRKLTGEVRQQTALLRRIDIFAGLDDPDLDILSRGIRTVTFAAGEQIIGQGEPGDSLFVIVEGDVLVSLGDVGRHHSIVTLHSGDFFGEMSLVTGEPRNATCSARTDVVCYLIGHDALQPLLSRRPQLAEHLSSLLAARQALLERKGGELSARNAQVADTRNKLLGRIKSFFELK